MNDSASNTLALEYATSRPVRAAEFRDDGETISIVIPAPPVWRSLLPRLTVLAIVASPLVLVLALIAASVLAPKRAPVELTSISGVLLLIALFAWPTVLAIVRLARATRAARRPTTITASEDELLVYQPQAMRTFRTWEG